MAAGDLTTAADVKAFADIPGTGGDAVLARLVTAASAFIADFTNRSLGAVIAYSEIRDGSGGSELFLANGPVASITSLTVSTTPIVPQPADGKAGYFLAGDVLCLSGYVFARGRKNVRVVYTGGYAAVPADIAQACIEMVASAYRRGLRGVDVQAETIESGQTYSFAREDVPKPVLKTLQRYAKVVPQ